jgi:predicted NAD-dependent protein-ADP-ribosyltransferase YbiA (DUF1768 family)
LKNIITIAISVVFQKFSKIKVLKEQLIDTRDNILVVAIMYDTLWGLSFHEQGDDEEGAENCLNEG